MLTNSVARLPFIILTFSMLVLLISQGGMPVAGIQHHKSGVLTMTPATPDSTPAMPAETQRALEYISRREGIPIEHLTATNQHRREYPMLGGAYWAVSALDTGKAGGGWYKVMVDLDSGMVVDDIEAVEQAEEAARATRYDKLDPALAERLAILGSDDRVPVAVWAAGGPKRV